MRKNRSELIFHPAFALMSITAILVVAVVVLTPSAISQNMITPAPFAEVTQDAGINTPHGGVWSKFLGRFISTGYISTGLAWGDYDNDGWVDLFLSGGTESSSLYRNLGDGTFVVSNSLEDTALAGVWTGGAVWADYDNDGFKDLYVLAHGANVLLRNENGRGFTDTTDIAGVGDLGKGSSAAWGDYDEDGLLVLFVAIWSCYPECLPGDNALARDKLYRNLGNGSFEDASYLLEKTMLEGAAFAVSFVDFDGDSDLDIYVVNDMAHNPIGNVMWRNDGAGCEGWCWSNASRETNTGIVAGGMGLAVGDFDNDLDLDLAFSDMTDPGLAALPAALLVNDNGVFQNISARAGVTGPGGTVGWGTAFFDYDNDSWLDLFLTTTHLTTEQDFHSAPMGMLFPFPNILYRNQGNGTFRSVRISDWQDDPKPSLGTAYADYDNDGFIDFIVGNFNIGYALHHNTGQIGTNNNWLTIRLEGRNPINRDAIGARVYVTTTDGTTRMQEVKSGSSFGAGNDTALHFGLDNNTNPTVAIIWPDGTQETFTNITTNRTWDIIFKHTCWLYNCVDTP